MHRTQIQLSEYQADALKLAAASDGVSMAELIRRSIDAWISRSPTPSKEERLTRLRALAGRFHSGRSDVSSKHDVHFADAIGP